MTDGWFISPSTANAVLLPHQREVLRASIARPYEGKLTFVGQGFIPALQSGSPEIRCSEKTGGNKSGAYFEYAPL